MDFILKFFRLSGSYCEWNPFSMDQVFSQKIVEETRSLGSSPRLNYIKDVFVNRAITNIFRIYFQQNSSNWSYNLNCVPSLQLRVFLYHKPYSFTHLVLCHSRYLYRIGSETFVFPPQTIQSYSPSFKLHLSNFTLFSYFHM